MSALTAAALGFIGLAALASVMDRHQDTLFGRALPATARALLRLGGAACIVAALAACWLAWSPSVAIAAWLGVLTLAASAVGLTLSYAPARMPWACGLALLALSAGVASRY